MRRILIFFVVMATLSLGLLPYSYGGVPLKNTVHDDHPNPFIPHDHQASFFVGGVLSVWHNDKAKSTNLHLHPEVGYFINKDWAVGLILGYGMHKHQQEMEHHFSVGPFVRYYYLHRGPFNLYLDGGVGFNLERSGEQTKRGFEVGIRPGACVDLTEGLCLCLRMGFVGYRDNFFAGEEPGIGKDGFGFHFTPEHLSIGIEIEF